MVSATPGPWTVGYAGSIPVRVEGQRAVPVAYPAWMRFEDAEIAANVYLIAAAPALYEALEKVVVEAEARPFNAIGHVVEHVIPEIRAALSAARSTHTEAK
jgi:uncharacterized membrane protein